jgi:hypothetical protein
MDRNFVLKFGIFSRDSGFHDELIAKSRLAPDDSVARASVPAFYCRTTHESWARMPVPHHFRNWHMAKGHSCRTRVRAAKEIAPQGRNLLVISKTEAYNNSLTMSRKSRKDFRLRLSVEITQVLIGKRGRMGAPWANQAMRQATP